MSWWRAKARNDHGEYEVTFGSKNPERAKAAEKVCKAVIDKLVKTPEDVAVVVRCKDCKHSITDGWICGGPDLVTMPSHPTYPNAFCSYGERRSDD